MIKCLKLFYFIEVRKVLVEKYKKWDYTDLDGNCFWVNKYGDIVKVEDSCGIIITQEYLMQDTIIGILSKSIEEQINKQIIEDIQRLMHGEAI